MKASSVACHLEEAELVDLCRQGEHSAFEKLVHRYQDRVFNTCWRICGNHSEAEDLTQEAFVKALLAIDRFDERSGFYTWIFRIATNLSISARRKAGRRATYSLNRPTRGDDFEPGGSPEDQLRADGPGPDQRASDSERQAAALTALASLEEEQRAIVILRDMESFGYDEIAEILEIPIGTVKSRLHRARLALREKLAGKLDTA
ncbi:MAG: sigma-70 family RNA polymerase sigma factor [Planctomycetota bacterium]|nr:sigma-70 family RNA polymerase sigma factor [Planctomycetota bacterium]